MRKILSYFLLSLAVVIVTLLALWYSAPYYAPSLIKRFVKDSNPNISIRDIVIERPNFSQLLVRHFNATQKADNGDILHSIEVHDMLIQLQFNWLSASLDAITIDAIDIKAHQQAKQASKPSSSPMILSKALFPMNQVTVNRFNYRSASNQQSSFNAKARFSDPDTLIFNLESIRPVPINLQGRLVFGQNHSLHISSTGFITPKMIESLVPDMDLPVTFTKDSEQLQWDFQTSLLLPPQLSLPDDIYHISGQSQFEIKIPELNDNNWHVSSPLFAGNLKFGHNNLSIRMDDTSHLHLRSTLHEKAPLTSANQMDFRVAFSNFALSMPFPTLSHVESNGALTIHAKNAHATSQTTVTDLFLQTAQVSEKNGTTRTLSGSAKSTHHIDVTELKLEEKTYKPGEIELALISTFRFDAQTLNIKNSGQLHAKKIQLEQPAQPKELALNDLQLTIKSSSVDINLSQKPHISRHEAHGELSFIVPSIELETAYTPENQHHITWANKSQKLNITHRIDFNTLSLEVLNTVNADLSKKTFQGNLMFIPHDNFLTSIDLSEILKDEPPSVHFSEGKLHSQAHYSGSFKEALQLKYDQEYQLKGANLSVFETHIQKLNSKGRIGLTLSEKSPSFLGAFDTYIDEIKLSNNVSINNFKSRQQLSSPKQIKVLDTSYDLLGATVRIDDFATDMGELSIDTIAHISNLPLDSVAQLASVNGLAMHGQVQGHIPISINKESFAIADGNIINNGKGTIEYRPQNQLDTLCFELGNMASVQNYALQNFQFNVLNANINVVDESTYQILLKLKGSNPNFCKGHPIHLNINVNYTAPDQLFSYLLMGDDVFKKLKKGAKIKD